jgi:glutamate synthase (NADPH/NADH) large chain
MLDLRSEAINSAALASGHLELAPLEDDDWDAIRDLLSRHADETDSPLASQLLDDVASRARFTRVRPLGWVRVREALAGVEAEGRGVDADGGGDGDESVVGSQQGWDQASWNRIVEVANG